MPKKIRVHELAKELGMSNQETLDLCMSLGMGVKSHSSSIEEAQADRARHKARRESLGSARGPEAGSSRSRRGRIVGRPHGQGPFVGRDAAGRRRSRYGRLPGRGRGSTQQRSARQPRAPRSNRDVPARDAPADRTSAPRSASRQPSPRSHPSRRAPEPLAGGEPAASRGSRPPLAGAGTSTEAHRLSRVPGEPPQVEEAIRTAADDRSAGPGAVPQSAAAGSASPPLATSDPGGAAARSAPRSDAADPATTISSGPESDSATIISSSGSTAPRKRADASPAARAPSQPVGSALSDRRSTRSRRAGSPSPGAKRAPNRPAAKRPRVKPVGNRPRPTGGNARPAAKRAKPAGEGGATRSRAGRPAGPPLSRSGKPIPPPPPPRRLHSSFNRPRPGGAGRRPGTGRTARAQPDASRPRAGVGKHTARRPRQAPARWPSPIQAGQVPAGRRSARLETPGGSHSRRPPPRRGRPSPLFARHRSARPGQGSRPAQTAPQTPQPQA